MFERKQQFACMISQMTCDQDQIVDHSPDSSSLDRAVTDGHIIAFHRCCSKVCFSFTESGYVDFSVYRYTKVYIRIRKNDIHSLRLSILLLHTTLPFPRYLVIMLEYASGSNSASRQFPLLSGIIAIRCASACCASKREISSSDTM